MRLYNTLSQQLEPLDFQAQTLSVYVCGITPYDTTHLGHAFTYASFDVLIRYLEMLGHRVRYTQNVTDVDDDILRKAAEVGKHWRALGNQWTAHFIQDMQSLNIRPPDHYPRATDALPEIVASVAQLVQAGVAYEAGGSVYFHMPAWPEYGRLSRLPRGEMLRAANERGGRPDDPHKKDPLDFVLWQASAPGEPAWDSPWGAGRPGWHIECSTLCRHYLGDAIDIHGGGADLVFPHHESEMAQAEAAPEHRPLARLWMHTAMVRHDGEKMSKSLGNLILMRDLLKHWSADALRLYLSSHHYRQSWSHEPGALPGCERLAGQLRAAVSAQGGSGGPLDPGPAQVLFARAMDDDLDTPRALAALERLADEVTAAAQARQDVTLAQAALRSLSQVFGLSLSAGPPEPRVLAGWNTHLKRFLQDEGSP